MADYRKMYATLFNAQTDAIELLQKAQQSTEQIYMDSPDPNIQLADLKKSDSKENE